MGKAIWWHRGTRAMTALLVAVAAAHGAVQSAAACVPNRPNDNQTYSAGTWRNPGSTIGGVYSKLRITNPYLHEDSANPISWAVVEFYDGLQFYARIGYEQPINFLLKHSTFVEYQTGSTHHAYGFNSETVGSDIYYTVLWQAGLPNRISFQRSGSTLIGPVGVGGYSPTGAEVLGEIHTAKSQMPGTTSSHELFYDTNIYYSGAWRAFDGITFQTNSTYHLAAKVTTKNYEIYDRNCSK